MSLFWTKVVLILAAISCTSVSSGGFENVEDKTPKLFKRELNKLVVTHLDLSLKYLYTGVGFGNQHVQKPGMAKYLRELSNSHWEEGFNVMKKYFKRGGNANDIYSSNAFNFEGENDLDMSLQMTRDIRIPYLNTMERLYRQSRECSHLMNRLHRMSVNNGEFHDADWGHYFEDKLDKEEERSRELRGYIATLEQMSKSSLALHVFDSHI